MRDLLNEIIDSLQATFPPNRIVALLTPGAAILAGASAQWLTEHFPGIAELTGADEITLTAAFLAGAGAVVLAAYKWLDGWQAHEGRVVVNLEDDEIAAELARAEADKPEV